DAPGGGTAVPAGARRRGGGPAIRLGLAAVRGLGTEQAEAVAAGRPYTGLEDFARRTALDAAALEALATAGAFTSLGVTRRPALWSAGLLARTTDAMLPGTAPALTAPDGLPEMTAIEETIADLWATGASATTHPVQHARPHLERCGAMTAADFKAGAAHGALVAIGGLVTHRQRPPTAGGVLFISLEDETGLVNIVCQPHVWERQRRTALGNAGLLVAGTAERRDGAINLLATRLSPLTLAPGSRSRDFR
ncbi:OB-fold nucleic acid binding domain-containing protein, partial [Kitasatospora purpeofusca]